MNCPHCQREAEFGEHGAGVCSGTGKQRRRTEPLPPPDPPKIQSVLKQCTRCKQVKKADHNNFFRRVGSWGSWCRACCRATTIASQRRRGIIPAEDPLKRAARTYGCAKKGSPEEAAAREALVAAVVGAARSAA